MTNPVTIGDLRREGKVLVIGCCECGRSVERWATELPFPDDQPVPTAGKRMRCTRCGSRTITTMPQLYDEPTFVRAARTQEQQQEQLRHQKER